MTLLASNPLLKSLLADRMERLIAEEGLDAPTITTMVDDGRMVLLANPAHAAGRPMLVGQPAPIKINANIGTSGLTCHLDTELDKARLAKAAGAHTIMDLSTGGDLTAIRAAIMAATELPLGTVPLYAVATKAHAAGRDPSEFTPDELLDEIRMQAEEGVAFMTLHCGLTRRGADLAGSRTCGIVSRGGAILARWMRRENKENPLLEGFDDLLAICKKHNVTISLGDGLRPGAGVDAGDASQFEEVMVLGELVKRARAAGVQTMVEGPGHVPLNQVAAQIISIKRLTHDAPLYVLGPLVTDIAPGYDHMAGAIGGAIAALNGADFLCYLTPAEHLSLPEPEDVWEGVMASRVAAAAAEAALGRPRARAAEAAMAKARADLDWDGMAGLCLDPALLRKRRAPHADLKECSMCGALCAIRLGEDCTHGEGGQAR